MERKTAKVNWTGRDCMSRLITCIMLSTELWKIHDDDDEYEKKYVG